jgi:hypothetical protein
MVESSIVSTVIKLIIMDQHATVCPALRRLAVSIDAKENIRTKAVGIFHQLLKTLVT